MPTIDFPRRRSNLLIANFHGHLWQPRVATRARAMVAGIIGSLQKFGQNSAQIMAWNAQFTSRVRRPGDWATPQRQFLTPQTKRNTVFDRDPDTKALGTQSLTTIANPLISQFKPVVAERQADTSPGWVEVEPPAFLETDISSGPSQRQQSILKGTMQLFEKKAISLPTTSPNVHCVAHEINEEHSKGMPSLEMNAVRQTVATSPAKKEVSSDAASFSVKSQRMFQEIIEDLTEPVTLPVVQMRLVTPEEHASKSINHFQTEQSETTRNVSESAPAMPSRIPSLQIDMNQLADKVYQMLLRRQQIERERKGFY